MSLKIEEEVAALRRMTVDELHDRYAEAFGEAPRCRNKPWLVKRIAWRLQMLAEGDLSVRARQRAVELARDADLRIEPPRPNEGKPRPPRERASTGRTTSPPALLRLPLDGRLPPPGSVITRDYRGKRFEVQVLPHGFEFEGQLFRSLSAVAKQITGAHCNGYFFFRLTKEGRDT